MSSFLNRCGTLPVTDWINTVYLFNSSPNLHALAIAPRALAERTFGNSEVAINYLLKLQKLAIDNMTVEELSRLLGSTPNLSSLIISELPIENEENHGGDLNLRSLRNITAERLSYSFRELVHSLKIPWQHLQHFWIEYAVYEELIGFLTTTRHAYSIITLHVMLPADKIQDFYSNLHHFQHWRLPEGWTVIIEEQDIVGDSSLKEKKKHLLSGCQPRWELRMVKEIERPWDIARWVRMGEPLSAYIKDEYSCF